MRREPPARPRWQPSPPGPTSSTHGCSRAMTAAPTGTTRQRRCNEMTDAKYLAVTVLYRGATPVPKNMRLLHPYIVVQAAPSLGLGMHLPLIRPWRKYPESVV